MLYGMPTKYRYLNIGITVFKTIISGVDGFEALYFSLFIFPIYRFEFW